MKYKDAQTNEDKKKCAFFSEFFSKVFLKTNQIKKNSFDIQLDVLLTNNPNIVITKTRNNEFNKSFKSDHDAFITTLQIEKTITDDTKHKIRI